MAKITRRTTIAAALAAGSQIGTKAVAEEPAKEKADSRFPSSAFNADELSIENAKEEGLSMKFMDNNTMMSLIYDIPVGAEAPQSPHGLDELYIVIKGRSKFVVDGREHSVESGTILFVKAGDEHQFKDIEEDLQVVIMFSKGDTKKPAYYERTK